MKSTDNNIDVCFCEPFLFPGLLPTLGVATLKAALMKVGVKCKIIYPSLCFYTEIKLYENSDLLNVIDNPPLQIMEYLFSKAEVNSIYAINNGLYSSMICKKILEELMELKLKCISQLDKIAHEIVALRPKVFCYSLTFGTFNFAFSLFKLLKKLDPNITIIVGGSNCSVDFSKSILKFSHDIDYVICDETCKSLVDLVQFLLTDKSDIFLSPNIGTANKPATELRRITDFDEIPCPDFNDFFDNIKALGINASKLTLPYEISRGCWWCEKKPCNFCGFFGNRKDYISKSSDKVIRELIYLYSEFGVTRFRFSDLVQPHKDYLLKLTDLEKYNFKFFWELRPDLSENDFNILRRIGLTYAQIGIESLVSDQLTSMNKGCLGIDNIYTLINASTYKIQVTWNYMYGFEDENEMWYEKAISIIPKIYHLQPPVARRLWLNAFSQLFECKPSTAIKSTKSSCFLCDDSFNIFFDTCCGRKDVYKQLEECIKEWQQAYDKGFALYIEKYDSDEVYVIKDYGHLERYRFTGNKAIIYLFFTRPYTLEDAQETLKLDKNDIRPNLEYFISEGLMIFIDNKYLSLATRSSVFKWEKHNEQVLYMGKELFEH